MPSSSSYAWAGGGQGDILLTRDGERTWQSNGDDPGSVPPPVDIKAMFFVTPELGWAVGSAPPSDPKRPAIQRSNDGGSTWQPVYQADLPDFRSGLRAITFAPSGIGWTVGDDGLVIRFDPAGSPTVFTFADKLNGPLSPSDWVLLGTAKQNPSYGAVSLTEPSPDELGYLFYTRPINTRGFNMTFNFAITGGGGGDGLAFILSRHIPTAEDIKVTGRDVGGPFAWAVLDGFGIEFDTHGENDGDPPGEHVGVTVFPDYQALATESLSTPLREGVYRATIEFGNQRVQVYLENADIGLQETLVLDYTIPDFVPFDAYFGFVGATGGVTDAHIVGSLAFDGLTASGGLEAPTSVGDLDIFVINADGSGRANLTNSPGRDAVPAWSPEGSRVAFTSRRTGDSEILVMGDDGTAQLNLTNHPGSDQHPTWSPDGGRIAFGSDRDGQFDVWVMNADGSGVTNLSNNPTFDNYPDWSPDGALIAFHSDRTGQHDIWVMNADGSGQRDLSDNPGAADSGPAWSPDGTRIAFVSDRDGNLEIFVMSADGSEQTQLTFTDPGGVNRWPAWSPDGGSVIFNSNRDGLGWNLWRMELATGALTNLTEPFSGRSLLADWARGPTTVVSTALSAPTEQAFLEDFEGDFADRVSLPEGFEIIEEGDGNHALLSAFMGHPARAADVITIPYPGDEGYTLHVEFNPLAQGNPGLGLGGPDGHYKLEFNLGPNESMVAVAKGSDAGDPEWREEAFFGPLQSDQWHLLAIQVLANEFKLFGPEGPILIRSDADPVLREGVTISPYALNEKVLFDNIGLKDAVLAKGVPAAVAAPTAKGEPAPAPAPEPETQRGFLVNTRPGDEAIPLEGLLDPVLLAIIGILVTIFAALIQLVRGR